MADARYAVYRLYDASGYLLYVGATKNVAVRMSQHRADKPWWPEVDDARTVVAWFDSVDGAAAAEFEAIRSESPAHNVASTDGRKPQMYRVPTGRRGKRPPRVRATQDDADALRALASAHEDLEALEAELAAERRSRNHALRQALASGVTWKRAGEVTGLSPRGIQISIREE